MHNPNERQIQKMMKALEELDMSQEELDRTEEYLEDGNEEHLAGLTVRSMAAVSQEICQQFHQQFLELNRKGKEQEMGRLFQVVFRLGHAGCWRLVPLDLFWSRRQGLETVPPSWVCAVYAEQIAWNAYYYLSAYSIERLAALAHRQPEQLRQALEYDREKYDNGRLLLYAAYFYVKYGTGHSEKKGRGDGEKGAVLQSLVQWFTKDRQEEHIVEEADQPYMNRYVDAIATSMEDLFQKQISRQTAEEMEAYMRQDKDRPAPPQLVQAAGGLQLDTYLLRLLAGAAFLNEELSASLRNMLRLCAACAPEETLEVLSIFNMDDKLTNRGGDLDLLLGIDQRRYILWAAKKNFQNILRVQFARSQEVYISCMKEADLDTYQTLLSVVQKQAPALFQQLKKDDQVQQREKVIRSVVPSGVSGYGELCAYLRDGGDGADIWGLAEELGKGSRYAWQEQHALERYRSTYGKDDFYIRCLVLLIFKKASYALLQEMCRENRLSLLDSETSERLFRAFDEAGLPLAWQLQCGELAYEYAYTDTMKKELEKILVKIFSRYLADRPEEAKAAFRQAGASGRALGVQTLGRLADRHKEELYAYSSDSSKAVRERLAGILQKKPEWKDDTSALLKSKKAAQRELAVQVLRSWKEDPQIRQLLETALETEKSSKLAALLRDVLQMAPEEEQGGLTLEEKVKELHKGGKKRVLAWAYETPFTAVHKTDGTEAEETYLQAILLCYASMPVPGVSQDAAWLAEQLNRQELAVYVGELFDKWLESGAEAKKKWVLYAASIHGGSEIVEKLNHQIREWPQHARGAIAAEAVKALAVNGTPQALMLVDGISRKFKFRQIKNAAGEALEFAAGQLGLTREELADRIVPDLGFNEQMERTFDYGQRQFRVYLTPALELEIYDGQEKKLKNLPAPGKRDDPEQAAAAYQAFKEMKKQMKATVASQKLRLEQALSVERKWKAEDWQALFVKNPVMHQFAIGLIWGLYGPEGLEQTFRYMEDGTFNTEDEEEMELPESSIIGLVHPVELSEESRKTWTEQLADYEVIQPFRQLDRTIYRLEPEEENARTLERFGGCILNGLSLSGKLQSMGWYRGSVQDGGGFYTFYREDAGLGLGVELHFSGAFVGGENEDVTVYDARFYQAGAIKRGSYLYDEVKPDTAIPLREVPARYFSEIVYQLTAATAASEERNENWRKEQ